MCRREYSTVFNKKTCLRLQIRNLTYRQYSDWTGWSYFKVKTVSPLSHFCFLQKLSKRSQDGRREGHGIHVSLPVHQEYIYKRNNSYTEHMLNIRRRLLTPKITRKIPSQWGRKKERKKKRIKKGTSNPGGKLKVRRGSCNQKIPSCGEISGDRKGTSEDQSRTQWTICGRQDKVRTVHTVCTAALPSLSHV